MTNFADKGIAVVSSWKAIEVDGNVVALAPAEVADRIARTLREAEEFADRSGPPHICPVCSHEESAVLDSRRDKTKIRRVRSCSSCGTRWTTHERMVRLIHGSALPDLDTIPDDEHTALIEALSATKENHG